MPLFDLVDAFREVVKRAELYKNHHILREPLSVRERLTRILGRINAENFVNFGDLFDLSEGRMGLVVTFLAILELLKESLLVIVQQPVRPDPREGGRLMSEPTPNSKTSSRPRYSWPVSRWRSTKCWRCFRKARSRRREDIRAVLDALAAEYTARGVELRQIGGGWRIGKREKYAEYVARLPRSARSAIRARCWRPSLSLPIANR